MGIPTPKQLDVLMFIIGYRAEKGFAAGYSEIAGRFGIARWAVQQQIRLLEKKGLLAHEFGKGRTLRPTVTFIPAENL